MNKILSILVLIIFLSPSAKANDLYAEVDISYTLLNILGSTNKRIKDIRFGGIVGNFDLSIRYFDDPEESFGGNSVDVDWDNGKYSQFSLRAGYFLSETWQLGFGLGRYNFEYELETPTKKINQTTDGTIAEFFLSYRKLFENNLHLKFELNISDGESLEISESGTDYEFTSNSRIREYLLLILLGYNF